MHTMSMTVGTMPPVMTEGSQRVFSGAGPAVTVNHSRTASVIDLAAGNHGTGYRQLIKLA